MFFRMMMRIAQMPHAAAPPESMSVRRAQEVMSPRCLLSLLRSAMPSVERDGAFPPRRARARDDAFCRYERVYAVFSMAQRLRSGMLRGAVFA